MTASCLGDFPAVRLEGDGVWLRSAAQTGVERVDGGDLIAGELEVEDVEVLSDAGWLGRLWNCRTPLLQVPAQHDLGRRLAVTTADFQQRWIVECALLPA